jgi:hypothetical protein
MVASFLTDGPLWRDIVPVPLFAAIVAAIVTIALGRRRRAEYPGIAAVVFAIALFGLVTGVMTGQSRDPAVGTVLPGVLTLIGGIIVYLAGTKDMQAQLLVAIVVATFSLNLLIGSYWGARLRDDFEAYRESSAYRLSQESDDQIIRLKRLLYQKKMQELRKEFDIVGELEPVKSAEMEGTQTPKK